MEQTHNIVLPTYFDDVEDFRVQGRCLHDLREILALVLFGSLCDCNDFQEIVDFSNDHISMLRDGFGFSLTNGVASVDTFERVFKYLDINSLRSCYDSLLADLSLEGKLINIDGKEMRSCNTKGKRESPVQVVNAWVSDYGLSFGQSVVEQKSNEIKAIPEILDMLDCKDGIVSIDAIGCQKAIVEKVIDKQADYLIAVKKNQKALYQEIENELLRRSEGLPTYVHRDLGHGRGEERKVWVLEDLSFVEGVRQWKACKSLVRVESKVFRDGKEYIFNRLFISSIKDLSAQKAYEYTRRHWGIENQLHWQLDVSFKEDQSTIRKENAIVNLHIIRKWALFLLKKDPDKMSIKRKRKKAARNIGYLKTVLTS